MAVSDESRQPVAPTAEPLLGPMDPIDPTVAAMPAASAEPVAGTVPIPSSPAPNEALLAAPEPAPPSVDPAAPAGADAEVAPVDVAVPDAVGTSSPSPTDSVGAGEAGALSPAMRPPARLAWPPPLQRFDRGQRVVLGAMAGLVVLGLALAVASRGNGASDEPPVGSSSETSEATPKNAEPSASAMPSPSSSAAPIASNGANGPNVGTGDDAGSAGSTETAAAPRTPVWRVKSLKTDPAVEVLDGNVGRRPLSVTLAQAGVSKLEVKRLLRAFEGVHHIERPERKNAKDEHPSKEAFVLARDRAKGTIVAFEFIGSPVDVWQAQVDEGAADKRLVAKKLDLFVEHRRIASALALATDLKKAVLGAGLREDAIESIDDALEGHIELTSLKSGVRLRVLSVEDWVEGAFARHRVEAIEFVPKSGATLRVYAYERDTKSEGSRRRVPLAGFYDAKGQQPYRGAFRSPLLLTRVTSRFNPKRMHPVLHTVMPHNGVDFGASTGTPVFASAAGTISTAGNGGRCGNMVQIEHANNLTTAYCHLSKFAAGLHAGQHVEARQVIGYVGMTGSATGPHLHFAVKRGGSFIDPLSLKIDGVKVLPSSDREAFAKRRAELDVALDAIALPSLDGTPDDKDDDKDEPAGEEE